jgi:glucose-6-phosphate-specific signal transduction histidine kinase
VLGAGADGSVRRAQEVAVLRQQRRRLQLLAERLVQNEESDRWRIARHLHDTIMQNISLANLQLGTLCKRLGEAQRTEETGKLGQVRELLAQTIEAVDW